MSKQKLFILMASALCGTGLSSASFAADTAATDSTATATKSSKKLAQQIHR